MRRRSLHYYQAVSYLCGFDRFALASPADEEEDRLQHLLAKVDKELDDWFADRSSVLGEVEKVVSQMHVIMICVFCIYLFNLVLVS